MALGVQAGDTSSEFSDDEFDDIASLHAEAPSAHEMHIINAAFSGTGMPPAPHSGRDHFLEQIPAGLPTALTPGFEWLGAFPSAVTRSTSVDASPLPAAVAASSAAAAGDTVPPEAADAPVPPQAPMSGRPGVAADDNHFYDDIADDDDEKWVNRKRAEAMSMSVGLPPDSFPEGLPQSLLKELPTDATLSCPFCFAVLTYVCQRCANLTCCNSLLFVGHCPRGLSCRHERYDGQFRSMFVQNCTVNRAEKLVFPASGSAKKKKKQQQPEECSVYAVNCARCDTSVGVYDFTEEVYHFCDVMPNSSVCL